MAVSLLSVAGWLSGRYDNEFKGFIEFTMPDSVNPRNPMHLSCMTSTGSYFGTVKPTTPKGETIKQSTYHKSTAPEVGLSADVEYGCQLKIGNDGMRYGRKGLCAYPAPRPALGGRPEPLVMDRDMRGLFYNCPEFRLFFRAQNSPHVVRRIVFARQ